MTKLNIEFHFLSPVQVVQVTANNLKEVAEWCGGKVERKESTKVPGRVDSYVAVPTPRGAAICMAFPKMYITKRLAITEANDIKATYSVFRRDYFTKNYFDNTQAAVDATWERHEAEEKGRAVMQQAIDSGSLTINLTGASNPGDVANRIKEAMAGNPKAVVFSAANPPELAKNIVARDKQEIVDEILDTGQVPLAAGEMDTPLSPVEQRQLISDEAIENASDTLDPHRP